MLTEELPQYADYLCYYSVLLLKAEWRKKVDMVLLSFNQFISQDQPNQRQGLLLCDLSLIHKLELQLPAQTSTLVHLCCLAICINGLGPPILCILTFFTS